MYCAVRLQTQASIAPQVFVIKHWAKQRQTNDAYRGAARGASVPLSWDPTALRSTPSSRCSFGPLILFCVGPFCMHACRPAAAAGATTGDKSHHNLWPPYEAAHPRESLLAPSACRHAVQLLLCAHVRAPPAAAAGADRGTAAAHPAGPAGPPARHLPEVGHCCRPSPDSLSRPSLRHTAAGLVVSCNRSR